LTPPTSYPLYVRIRAVVADWEVPMEKRSEFLIADALSIPEVTLIDEDQDEKLRTRAAIRGTAQGRTPSKPGNAEPGGGLNRNLMRGALEHLIREVVEEKSFSQLVEGMLAQDAPFSVQYEDSPPPGEPDHREPSSPAATSRSPAVLDNPGDGGFEELKALLNSRPEPVWGSELLNDFPEPSIPDLSATSSARAGGAASSSDGPAEPTVPPSPGALSEAPPTPSQAVLDEALSKHGEVNLEAFKTSAGDVLDQLLHDVMDDVIAGRLNWQRPLPRVRGRGRER